MNRRLYVRYTLFILFIYFCGSTDRRSPMTLEIEKTNGSFSPGSFVLQSQYLKKLHAQQVV